MNNRKFWTLLLLLATALALPALAADAIPIVIDGYEDDWSDKPISSLYNGKNPKPDSVCSAALFSDGDFLYIYLKNSVKGNREIEELPLSITINGQSNNKFLFKVNLPEDEDGSEFNLRINGEEVGFGIYREGEEDKDGEEDSDEEQEWAEISIPITFFAENPDEIDQILLNVHPWGKQDVPLSGIGTAPWLGLALCALPIAGFSFWKIRKAKKETPAA